MLKERISQFPISLSKAVLILILMEHAQRANATVDDEDIEEYVLILILMEHAQRA